MDERYQMYNEITFVNYCMTAIKREVQKGRIRKAKHSQQEISFSSLPEGVLQKITAQQCQAPLDDFLVDSITFPILDCEITVSNQKLGRALAFLPRQRRDILLMAYFLEMNDGEIGRRLHIKRNTVQWRRSTALQQLKALLEDYP